MTRASSVLAWTICCLAVTAACGEGQVILAHPGVADAPGVGGQALCAGGATLEGVDVSDDQGSIDWGQAKGAGIAWAYSKATESTNYEATTFAANWAGMKSAGVVRGAYHFFHPNVDGTPCG